MDFWLLISLLLLIAPFVIIISLAWLPFSKYDSNKPEKRIPADGLQELIALLKQPASIDTIALTDVSLVDNSDQKLVTGLELEKKLTRAELKECIEELPISFIHYSNNHWVNRFWIQKIESNKLKLYSGRKVSFLKKEL